jgi:hypothetical protein
MTAVIVRGVKIKYHISKFEVYKVYLCAYVLTMDLSASSCDK